MLKIRYLLGILIIGLGAVFYSCQEDDYEFGDVKSPQNLTLEAMVLNTSEEFPYGNGSGEVQITASADNAITYEFFYGDNTSEIVPSGDTIHPYSSTGVNTYDITVVAKGIGGASTSASTSVTVFSAFDDPEVKNLLTGGDSKTWYVASELPAHLGVGPNTTATPDYYSAAPGEKAEVNGEEGCFYDDAITFSLEGGQIHFNHENNGDTFFNASYNSVGGGSGSDDQCLPFDTSGDKIVSLSAANSQVPEDQTTGTKFIISDGGFMSYYINNSTYEVLEINETFMEVRASMGPGGDQALAWYLKFTTDPEGGSGGSSGGSPLETQFNELLWEDEFDQGSEPNSQYWNYEIGNGNNGWGNGEEQYYTDENAVVQDDMLTINLIKEPTSGFEYSSSRITTQNKFEFTYGRVEVRAKLPEGGGVWPAIWMLGAADIPWPDRGEIDIMEFNGNEPDLVSSALHFPGNFAGDAVSEQTLIENPSTEFHDYTLEWREDKIMFALDGIVYHEFTNTPDTPYHDPFFMILNVAMGGIFVNYETDPNFQQSEMQIDYVRVYQ
ncbi:family 16 glycosylhydrolase [Mesonia mobilis]|uniref:family 16 glycosylhydrolase n=1 Tax=Mesonia mobilis TaxID=369791 RepID=UPI0026EF971B|nr:family 16 glycosylhydrolase [Mesonia mobilis]